MSGEVGERGARLEAPDPLSGTAYETIGRLGKGGMGVVLEARHRRHGARVVVKILHAHLAGHDDLIDRMHLEARALAALAPHPNIVAILDGGKTEDGRPFLVLERLEGRTLDAERRLRGRLLPAEAIDFVVQALAALEAVHAAGLVHRDVKPANLFACDAPTGQRRALKLLDFGVAKLCGGGAASPISARASVTEEHALVGTPAYVAPEQAVGGAVDARTDLYAMGVVLFQLLAGRAPFEHHESPRDVLHAHLLEEPRPPSVIVGPSVPPALDRVVLRALAKRPADRFQDASSFAAELRRIARDLDRPARAEETRSDVPIVAQPALRSPREPRHWLLAFAAVWLLSLLATVGAGMVREVLR
ncbi:MAG: serine/threonine-protein kinase [Polyangiaceae bacterium]